MTINEVENILNITRANIRYYEKEGFISPKRNQNGYRDYSNEDIAILKEIIIFRKIGLSITTIKSIFNNEISLCEAINENITNIENQIIELKGALELSKRITDNKTEINDFDEEKYFNILSEEEKQGNKFNDILKDYLNVEKTIFFKMWKNVFFLDVEKFKKNVSPVHFAIIIIAICVIRGLAKQYLWHSGSFFEGFIYPFAIFAIASAIILPLYWLSKKHEKLASIIASIVVFLGIVFLIIVIGALIYGIIHSFFA